MPERELETDGAGRAMRGHERAKVLSPSPLLLPDTYCSGVRQDGGAGAARPEAWAWSR